MFRGELRHVFPAWEIEEYGVPYGMEDDDSGLYDDDDGLTYYSDHDYDEDGDLEDDSVQSYHPPPIQQPPSAAAAGSSNDDKQQNKSQSNCVICQDPLGIKPMGMSAPCGCVHHVGCFEQWATDRRQSQTHHGPVKCPLCDQVSQQFVKIFLDTAPGGGDGDQDSNNQTNGHYLSVRDVEQDDDLSFASEEGEIGRPLTIDIDDDRVETCSDKNGNNIRASSTAASSSAEIIVLDDDDDVGDGGLVAQQSKQQPNKSQSDNKAPNEDLVLKKLRKYKRATILYRKECKSLTSEFRDKCSKMEKDEKRTKELEGKISKHRKDFDSLHSELGKRGAQMHQLQRQNDQASDKMRNMEQQHSSHVQRHATVVNELTIQCRQLEEQVKKARKRANPEVRRMKEGIPKLKRDNELLVQELQELKKKQQQHLQSTPATIGKRTHHRPLDVCPTQLDMTLQSGQANALHSKKSRKDLMKNLGIMDAQAKAAQFDPRDSTLQFGNPTTRKLTTKKAPPSSIPQKGHSHRPVNPINAPPRPNLNKRTIAASGEDDGGITYSGKSEKIPSEPRPGATQSSQESSSESHDPGLTTTLPKAFKRRRVVSGDTRSKTRPVFTVTRLPKNASFRSRK